MRHLLPGLLLILLVLPAATPAAEPGTLNPRAPARTAEFGFLVGEWLAEITVERPDGVTIRATADWNIRYIMDGWALCDDWYVTLEDGTVSNHGTMYRTVDPRSDSWKIVEQVTPRLEFTFMTAEPEGDAMVMYEHAGGFDGALTGKRVFSEIKPDSFFWRHYHTADGGKTWIEGATMDVTRKK